MADVEVRASPIEGLGVFATRRFDAGERIRRISVVREITADAPLRPDLGERLDHCDYPDGRTVLIGYPDRHLNHSCDPSAYVRYEAEVAYIAARRPIAVGEEITCDYNINISGGTSWPCRCGAARCRGETIGDFFLLPVEAQLEYRPLLADWFVRRHRKRIERLDGLAAARGGMTPGHRPDRALRLIAWYKFCKAALLTTIALGALRLLQPEVAAWAERWTAALALRHDRRLVGRFIALVSGLSSRRLHAVAIGALVLAALFATEGVGLWRGKRWAEYLTVIATTLFVPVEIFELARAVTLPRLSALLLNLAVVAFLVYRLQRPASPDPCGAKLAS